MKTDKPENVNIRILYWKEIPLQIEVESGGNRVSKQLDNRFQEGVDAIAMFENNYGTEVYLNGFQWGERFSLAGETNNILNDIVNKFNTKFPQDFVSRIRDMDRQSKRKSTPGSVDEWMEE